MAKQKRNPHPPMTPRYIGGVVVTRIPLGTPEPEKAKVMAVAKQMAYDHSEHPTIWGNTYKKRSWK
ncbi:MAG: hypothetical protein ACOH18_05490 [Candidatus Saccharimonadaceae bacterium]